MDKNLMERFAIERDIHTKRFIILQHYMYLYGARLKGETCRYEKFNAEEISPSSREGKACAEVLMEAQQAEEELAVLLEKLNKVVDKQLAEQN
ncbi:hypothetical protein [Ralstonia pseudosolanacearum]